jgi:hypothetical protein
LKELKENHRLQVQNRNQEINKLVEQLDNTKERLKFHQDNLKTKEGIITEYQQETKNQAETLIALQNQKEQLSQAKEQREAELSQQLTLTGQKIVSLEISLLNLSKQKLTNQKQAKALVEQIEKEWKEKQEQWQTQTQQQQDHFAQTLAQTKSEHQEEIKSLKTQAQQSQLQAVQQEKTLQEQKLQRTKENLETQISSLELKLEVNQREKDQELNQAKQIFNNLKNTLEQERQAWTRKKEEMFASFERQKQELNQTHQNSLQEQKTLYQNQIQAEKNQNQTHQQTITQLNSQITNQQTNINQLTTQNQRNTETIRTNGQRINQLEEYLRTSQQDNQTKQQTITNLNQDKVNLQQQITQLTQTQTENTRSLNEQQETIANLNQTLARQKTVLEQLLTKLETMTNYELEDFKTWLEADPTRKDYANSRRQNWCDYTFSAILSRGDNWSKVLQGNHPTFATHQAKTVLDWKAEVDNQRRSSLIQEITLIKEILSHDM